MKKNVLVLSLSTLMSLAACGGNSTPELPSIHSSEENSSPTKDSSSEGSKASSSEISSSTSETSQQSEVKSTSSSSSDSRDIVEFFTIVLDFAGGEAFSYPTEYTPISNDIHIPNPTREGHIFRGWQPVGSEDLIQDLVIPTGSYGDRHYVAVWEVAKVHITIDPQLGDGQTYSIELDYGTEAEIPDYSRPGYTFLGWVNQNGDTFYSGTYVFKSDDTFVAQWELAKNAVFYELNGGVNDPENPAVYGGEPVSLKDPTREGYTFQGWTTFDGEEPMTGRLLDASDIGKTYTAHWKANMYEITFEDRTSETVSYQVVTFDEPYSLPVLDSGEGRIFNGWTYEGEPVPQEGVYQYPYDVCFEASWTLIDYSIRVDLGGGVSDETYPETYNVESPNIYFAAPSREGYNFLGWSVDGVPVDGPAIPSGSVGDKYISARWEEAVAPATYHTITFDVGEDAGAMPTWTVQNNTDIGVLPTPTRLNYDFDGWLLDGKEFNGGYFDFGKDITLVAKWKPHAFALIYDLDGGTLETTNPTTYTVEDTPFLLQNPTKEGYIFKGWKEGPWGLPTTSFYVDTSKVCDIHIFAVFELINLDHFIYFYSDYGTTPDALAVREGEPFTLPTLSAEGYDFLGWETAAGEAFGDGVYSLQKDFFLRAKWQLHQYKIQYELDGVENAVNNPSEYNIEDGTIYIYAPQGKEHYVFVGWKRTDDPSGTLSQTYTFDAGLGKDITFIAVFELTSTWIYASPGYQGTGGGNFKVPYGESYSIPAPSKTNYVFLGWKDQDGKDFPAEGINDFDVSAIYLSAQWAPKEFAITYDLQGGEVERENPQTYTCETYDLYITPPTKAGYNFIGWTINGVDYQGGYTINASLMSEIKDLHFVARYDAATYWVGFDLNGGSDYLNGFFITQNDQFGELPSAEREGYSFGGWEYEGALVQTGDTFTFGKDITLVARWIAHIAYDLDGGTNHPDNPVAYGEASVTLADPSKEGYTFIGWTTEDSESPMKGYVLDPSQPGKTYKAHWAGNQYTLTFVNDDGDSLDPMVVTMGENVDIPVATKLGYTLQYWVYFDANENSHRINIGTQLYNVPKDLTLYPIYSEDSYALTYVLYGGTNASSNFSIYYSSRNTTIYAPTRAHYDFVGWAVNGVGEPVSDLVIPRGTTGDIRLEAVWVEHQYSVFFYYNNGTNAHDYSPAYYDEYFDYPSSNPTRDGYVFQGWAFADGQMLENNRFTYDDNLYLYAKWEAEVYSIYYKDGGLGNANVSFDGLPTSFTTEDKPTLGNPTTSLPGWQFLGWVEMDNQSANPQEDFSLSRYNRSVTMVPVWHAILNYRYSDDSGQHPQFIMVRMGQAIPEFTVPAPTGYHFTGWTIQATGEAFTDTVWQRKNISEIVLVANYEEDVSTVFTIRYDFGGGYQDDNPLQFYPISYDSEAAMPTIGRAARKGYTFLYWQIQNEAGEVIGELNGKTTLPANSSGNLVLVAVYEAKSYTIYFTLQGGTVLTQIDNVHYGDTVTLPLGVYEGYDFLYWVRDGAQYQAGASFTFESTYNAYFEGRFQESTVTHTITYVMNGGENNAQNPTEYTTPTNVDYIYLKNPTTRYGYSFKGWSITEASTPDDNPTYVYYFDTSTKKDYTFYAVWEVNAITIYLYDYGTAYTGPTQFAMHYGDPYDFPTENMVKEGYTFLGWQRYDSSVGQRVPIQASGEAWPYAINETLYGSWQANTYNIEYRLDGGTIQDTYRTTYTIEDNYVLPTPTQLGYTFLGWSFTNNIEDALTRLSVKGHSGDLIAYAHWRDDRIEVTLDVNGGTLPEGTPTTIKMAYGWVWDLPTPTRSGYTFSGWYYGESRITQGSGFYYSQPFTLTARYEAIRYSVYHEYAGRYTYYSLDDGSKELTLIEDIPYGYHFKRWKVRFDVGTPIERTEYYDNVILNETFTQQNVYVDYEKEANTHTIYIEYRRESFDGEVLLSKEETFTYGEFHSFVKPEYPEYVVNGCQFNGSYIDLPFERSLYYDSDITVVYRFSEKYYRVNYEGIDYEVMDFVDPNSIVRTFRHRDGTCVFSDLHQIGKRFLGWTIVDSNGVLTSDVPAKNLTLDVSKAGNLTLTPHFEDIEYRVYYDTYDGEYFSAKVKYNDEISLPEISRLGYVFEGWNYNGRIVDSLRFTKYDLSIWEENELLAGISLTASWKLIQYGASFDYDGGRVDNPNLQPQSFTIEDNLKLVSPNKMGYTFLGYTSEVNDVAKTDFTAEALIASMVKLGINTIHFKAVYEAKKTHVTFILKEGETVLGEEAYDFTYDQPFTLPLATKIGYEFLGWGEDNLISGDAWHFAQEEISFSGSYEAKKYTLTVVTPLREVSFTMTYDSRFWFDSQSLRETGYNFRFTYRTEANGQGEVFTYNEDGDWTYDHDVKIYGDYWRTINYVTNGGNSLGCDDGLFTYEGTSRVATRTGYTFGGWYIDEGLHTPYSVERDNGNITLYAWWKEETPTSAFTFEMRESGGVRILSCSDQSEEIVIPAYIGGKGVVEIADYAFANLKNLKRMSIPSHIQTVGRYIFDGCTSLETLRLAYSAQEIGYYFSPLTNDDPLLYEGGSRLGETKMPKSLTRIELNYLPSREYAFFGAAYLETVIFDWLSDYNYNAYTFPAYCFAECSSLKTVSSSFHEDFIGIHTASSPVSFGAHAFENCILITQVQAALGNRSLVKAVGDYAFAGCTNLIYFNADQEIMLNYDCESVGTHAFVGCHGLTKIYIPNASIAREAFYDMPQVTDIRVTPLEDGLGGLFVDASSPIESEDWVRVGGVDVYQYLPSGLRVVGLSNAAVIAPRAFIGLTSLERLSLYYIEEIGESAFEGCINFYIDSPMPSAKSIGARAFYNCSLVEQDTLKLPPDCSIGVDAFYGTHLGQDLTIDAQTSAGFVNAPVETLTIASYPDCGFIQVFPTVKPSDYETYEVVRDGVTYYVPTALNTIILGEGITSIPVGQFAGLTSLKNFYYSKNSPITELPASAFEGCTNLVSFNDDRTFGRFVLPETLTKLGAKAFQNCSSIYELIYGFTFPVTAIGDEAFAGCSGIEIAGNQRLSLTLNNPNLTYLGSGAFAGTKFRSITLELPKTAVIGTRIFAESDYLIHFATDTWGDFFGENFPSTIASLSLRCDIPDYGFKDVLVNELETFYISGNIGAHALENCSGVKAITGSVKTVGDYAFYGSGLSVFPSGCGITSIGAYAFASCQNLTSVGFFAGLTSVGDYAFANNTHLRAFYESADANPTVGEAILYQSPYISELRLAKDYDFTSLFGVPLIDLAAYYPVTYKQRVGYLPNTLQRIILCGTTISAGRFANMRSLVTVSLPDKPTQVPEYAFAGCSNLVYLYGVQAFTSIGDYAFYRCDKLEAFDLYWQEELGCNAVSYLHVTSIGAHAFEGVPHITSTYIDYGTLEYIGDYAFANSRLNSFNITKRVEYGIGIFKNCPIYSLYVSNMPKTGIEYFFRGSEACDTTVAIIQGGETRYYPAVLRELKIWSSVLPDYCLQNFTQLRRLEINNVEHIGAYALSGLRFNLEEARYSFDDSQVKSIGDFAFAYGDIYIADIRGLEVGTGIYEGLNIYALSISSFPEEGLASLFGHQPTAIDATEVQIGQKHYYVPKSLWKVTYECDALPDYAFAGCSGLKQVNDFKSGELHFGEETPSIGAYAFVDTRFSILEVDARLTDISKHAFDGMKLGTFQYSGDAGEHFFQDYFGESTNSLELVDFRTATVVPERLLENLTIGRVRFAQNLTYIGDYAFYHFAGDVVIHNSVFAEGNQLTYIGDYASIPDLFVPVYFSSCLTYVGDYAFLTATELHIQSECINNHTPTGLFIGASSIEVYDETGFADYDYAELIYGNYAAFSDEQKLIYDEADTHEYILHLTGGGVIPAHRFEDDAKLAGIYFTEPITEIGSYAFAGCYNLINFNPTSSSEANYVASSSLARIGDYAFAETNLRIVNLSGAEVEIGAYAFADSRTQQVAGGSGVTSVGAYAFVGSQLFAMSELENATSIGDYAFYGLRRLRSSLLGAKLVSIGEGAFAETGHHWVIYIPISVTTVGKLAFNHIDVIYVEAPSKPEGWDDEWYDGLGTVEWGHIV